MATWKKALVVALVAVVGLVPVFGRIGYAQALPEPLSVPLDGQELSDEELLKVESELVWWLRLLLLEMLAGALMGWLTYEQTGDPWLAAKVGLAPMTVFTLGVAATPPVGSIILVH